MQRRSNVYTCQYLLVLCGLLFQVVAVLYELVEHQENLVFLIVLIHMCIVYVDENSLIWTIHNLW